MGSHVRNVFREQGMHQTHDFASCKREGAFMLMFGHFLILAPIVGLVLQVVAS
jgi:hypothetical protein